MRDVVVAERTSAGGSRLTWAGFGFVIAAVFVVSLVSGAWLHSICHPSGDVWLSASGNPENYCTAVGGDESAWLSCAAATIPAAALIGLGGRRTRWSMAIAAIALLASAANFTAFWVVFTRG